MPINPAQPSTWITIKDKKVCPDCEKLAGKTMALNDWIASGILPGNGHTVCGEWCRCVVAPADWADDFGQTTIDTSIPKITGLLDEVVPDVLPMPVMSKWEVMLEKESAIAGTMGADLAETVRLYKEDPEALKAKYPKHYKLLLLLLGL